MIRANIAGSLRVELRNLAFGRAESSGAFVFVITPRPSEHSGAYKLASLTGKLSGGGESEYRLSAEPGGHHSHATATLTSSDREAEYYRHLLHQTTRP